MKTFVPTILASAAALAFGASVDTTSVESCTYTPLSFPTFDPIATVYVYTATAPTLTSTVDCGGCSAVAQTQRVASRILKSGPVPLGKRVAVSETVSVTTVSTPTSFVCKPTQH